MIYLPNVLIKASIRIALEVLLDQDVYAIEERRPHDLKAGLEVFRPFFEALANQRGFRSEGNVVRELSRQEPTQ